MILREKIFRSALVGAGFIVVSSLCSCGRDQARLERVDSYYLDGLWHSDVEVSLTKNESTDSELRKLIKENFGRLFYYFHGDEVSLIYLPEHRPQDLKIHRTHKLGKGKGKSYQTGS